MNSALNLSPPPSLPTLLEKGALALFLDFDGTLVELASGPDEIDPREDIAEMLEALAARLDGRCAVVSGRAISDIEKHAGPLAIALAGSHGADVRAADGEVIGKEALGLPEKVENLLRSYAGREGLDYEHKPHGGALHYRRNPNHGPRAHAFAEAIASEHDCAVQGGKFVVELVAKGADKGTAVAALMETAPFAGALPVFLGDDLTDEAGFRACQERGGLGVLVGDRRETCADHALFDVAAVHQWLEI